MATKAKAPAKKTSKPAKAEKPTSKKPVKQAAKAPAAKKAAAKPAPKPAPAPAVKAAPAKAPLASAKSAAKPATPSAPRPGVVASISALPTPPAIVPKPVSQRPVSDKDLAAATEYLLTRSAGRSEAPVVVNGKRLPTEEELLRMSENDYMNDSQLAFFKHRLQEIERELLANADETTEHLRETVIVPDPADRATIEEEHALELRTRDRERKLLKKVQGALARIEGGDYGFCEETGDPIGIPRLLARPTATLSLEAQQRREMKQKLYGD